MDYWIAIDKQKIGPLSLEEVRRRRLDPDTLVWHQGLPTWRVAAALPELSDSLSSSPIVQPTAPRTSPTPPPTYRAPYPAQPYPAQAYNAPESRPQQIPDKPPTYLGWNIASIILCCLPLGIIATIFSTKVNSRYAVGDYDGARRASQTAELLLIISIVVGLVCLPFQILMNLL